MASYGACHGSALADTPVDENLLRARLDVLAEAGFLVEQEGGGSRPDDKARYCMTILAVTGLTKEAEIVGTEGVVAVAGGGDAKALAEKLDALHGDITGVISIGLGGALSPHLRVGDIVIGERVIAGAEIFPCDNLWRVTHGGAAAGRPAGRGGGQHYGGGQRRRQGGPVRGQRWGAGGGHGKPGGGALRRQTRPQAGGAAGDFRRCRPCPAARRPGGDEAGWRGELKGASSGRWRGIRCNCRR